LLVKSKAFIVPSLEIVGIQPDSFVEGFDSFTVPALVQESIAVIELGICLGSAK